MTPEQLALATAQAMYESDMCSRALGLELLEARPGYARMQMNVRADFLNGHGICHGGMIFTLADSTFAFACNSYNINTVAAGCSRPGRSYQALWQRKAAWQSVTLELNYV